MAPPMMAPAAAPPTMPAPVPSVELGATMPPSAAAVPPIIAPVPAPLAVFDGGAPELAQPDAKSAAAVAQQTSGVRGKRRRGEVGLMGGKGRIGAPASGHCADRGLFSSYA